MSRTKRNRPVTTKKRPRIYDLANHPDDVCAAASKSCKCHHRFICVWMPEWSQETVNLMRMVAMQHKATREVCGRISGGCLTPVDDGATGEINEFTPLLGPLGVDGLTGNAASYSQLFVLVAWISCGLQLAARRCQRSPSRPHAANDPLFWASRWSNTFSWPKQQCLQH